MKNIRHWTLKYIVNRIKVFIFENKYPEYPWLTRGSILFLEQWLRPDDIVFEWGSGKSTVWFSKKVRKIISIEHDIDWYNKIKKIIHEKKLEEKIDYFFINEKEDKYYKIIENYNDNYFDVILVDGRQRDKCAILSLKKIKKGGIIVVDNAERYLPNTFDIPQSIGKNFSNDVWKSFYTKVKENRKYWVNNGVGSTLIIFF